MKRISALVLLATQLATTPALAQMNPTQTTADQARPQETARLLRDNQARPQSGYLSIGQPKLDNRNDWRAHDSRYLDYQKVVPQ